MAGNFPGLTSAASSGVLSDHHPALLVFWRVGGGGQVGQAVRFRVGSAAPPVLRLPEAAGVLRIG